MGHKIHAINSLIGKWSGKFLITSFTEKDAICSLMIRSFTKVAGLF